MIILVAMLTVAVLIIVTGVMLGLRTWVRYEAAAEKRLRAPETHTLDFEVPNGRDPAPLMAALAGAHFTSITRTEGGTELLTIACEEQDRSRVRDVLEHAHAASASGPDEYLGQVRFIDEV
jgi:hypothetical protein